jgi:prephenate dehydrogenase
MKAAIIGGSGKMGQWAAHFLLKEGYEVIITGRNKEKLLEAKQQLGVNIATNAEAVKHADIVVISVPIDSFEVVIEQLGPYIPPKQVVIDITSVKALPVEIMHRHIKTGLVLGVHPMFGPSIKSIAGQNFVLTPTNEEEKALAHKVREYLEARRARITLMSPQEHDDMMTIILGLSHFIAIVSADTLLSTNKLKLTRAISGTTYEALLRLVESVISENPELYASLQMSLPNMSELEQLFQKCSKTWTELVQKKDRQEFIRKMSSLNNSFTKNDPTSLMLPEES